MRDERRTNKRTVKIELLSQWKLEAEFRKKCIFSFFKKCNVFKQQQKLAQKRGFRRCLAMDQCSNFGDGQTDFLGGGEVVVRFPDPLGK